MPRLRLGVVLLVPEPLAVEIDGLRRACGGPLDRVPPHLTLVPPVNVRVEDVPAGLRVLRDAAASVRPFTLRLGPPSTFLPTTPTLHLAVGGKGEATTVLRSLRDAVFQPPFERPLTHPFVPHVTLSDDVAPDLVPGAVAALAGYVVDARFERVHVLEEQRHGEAHRRWVPVADAPFASPIVVGRGGVELDLAVSRLLDPECRAFEAGVWPDGRPSVPAVEAVRPGAVPVVVAARRRGSVVGVVRGSAVDGAGEVSSILVAPTERGQGIARQLTAAFDHAASVPGLEGPGAREGTAR